MIRIYKSKKIGKKFGRLLVIKTIPRYWKGKRFTYYVCRCDCGKKTTTSLINTKSCGCLRKDLLIQRNHKRLSNETVIKDIYRYYKRNAKKRSLLFKLTYDKFKRLILKPCYYCKTKEGTVTKAKWSNRIFKHNGIDRFNNNQGYTMKNSIPCCTNCNQAKNNRTIKEFKQWAKKLYYNFIYNREEDSYGPKKL